jgi:hypothetical protein
MDNPEKLPTLGKQDTERRQAKQINVRENRRGNQEWTIQRKLPTLGTQDTGRRKTKQINVRENRRGNQEWTIQRNYQHWVHKKQEEDKQSK